MAWSGDLAGPSRWAAGERRAARVVRVAGAAGLLVGGALLFAHALRPAPAAVPPAPEMSPPLWRDIDRPAVRYRLEAPLFAETPTAYAARLHLTGGGREDTLSFGAFAGGPASTSPSAPTPALRLRIFRRAAEEPSRMPLFAAIAHEAAHAGLSVERIGLPEILPTRFGRFDVVDVALAGSAAGPEQTCSAFRLVRDAPALSITGLACGGAGTPPARPAIACLVDSLSLDAHDDNAHDDQELSDFFVRTGLDKDPGCPATTVVAEEPAVGGTSDAERKLGKAATSRKSLRRR